MDSSDIILYIGSAVFTIAISAYIFSLVLNIPKLIKYNRMQVQLLKKIAIKHNVSDEEINEITKQ